MKTQFHCSKHHYEINLGHPQPPPPHVCIYTYNICSSQEGPPTSAKGASNKFTLPRHLKQFAKSTNHHRIHNLGCIGSKNHLLKHRTIALYFWPPFFCISDPKDGGNLEWGKYLI